MKFIENYDLFLGGRCRDLWVVGAKQELRVRWPDVENIKHLVKLRDSFRVSNFLTYVLGEKIFSKLGKKISITYLGKFKMTHDINFRVRSKICI